MATDATYRGTVYPWQCDHVGAETVIAIMTGTLMALPRREEVPALDGVHASA